MHNIISLTSSEFLFGSFCIGFKLAELQVELQRMNSENQKLRGMLTQVNNNYNALNMQLEALMHQQQNSSEEKRKVIVV